MKRSNVSENENIFAIFDKKSGEHFGLSVWPNAELFKRSLVAEVNDKNPRNLLSAHASDFELYALGHLDLKNGEISPRRVFICNVVDLKGDISE